MSTQPDRYPGKSVLHRLEDFFFYQLLGHLMAFNMRDGRSMPIWPVLIKYKRHLFMAIPLVLTNYTFLTLTR